MTLLFNRALGVYSIREYRLFIKYVPGEFLNKLLSLAISMIPRALLYVPTWIYIKTRLSDSNFVLFNLNQSWINSGGVLALIDKVKRRIRIV